MIHGASGTSPQARTISTLIDARDLGALDVDDPGLPVFERRGWERMSDDPADMQEVTVFVLIHATGQVVQR